METMRDLVWWTLAAIAAVVLIIYLFVAPSAWAGGTVTYTDINGEVTGTKPLGPDGRFNYRVEVRPHGLFVLQTHSVYVADDTGQMQSLCLEIASAESDSVTVSVISEVVVAVQPIVMITGRAFNEPGCEGQRSASSNPITVEFVPEPPGLLAPLPQ